MFTLSNLSRATTIQTITEADIALEPIHSSPKSLHSNQSLIADRPPDKPYTLLPTRYPVFVVPYHQGQKGEKEWVMITEPFEVIGVGSELIGMFRDEGSMATPEVAGEVTEVERFERRHVIFRVEGGAGLRWKVGVRYAYAKVGGWKRAWIFLTRFVSRYPVSQGESWVSRLFGYICGPLEKKREGWGKKDLM